MNKKTILSMLCGALAFCSTTTVTAASDVEIFGSVVFGDGWSGMEDAPYGIYSVMAQSNAPLNLVKKGTQYVANGGGVYVGGKYYSIGYERGYWGELAGIYFRVFDVENDWALIREVPLSRMSDIPTDLTYNPKDDCVYGCFRTDDETIYTLSRLDLLTGKATMLGELEEQLVSIAARKDGVMYAMGISGIVYRINLTNGVILEKVGESGITVRYAQSATFDNASDRLFWSATMHDVTKGSSLYEVNLENGGLNFITQYPGGMEMTGIFTNHEAVYDAAPSRVTDAQFIAANDDLNSTISFTMPSTTYGGTSCSGAELGYEVVIDENINLFKSGTAMAGSTVALPCNFVLPGMHMLRISATNSVGRSPVAIVYRWIGADKAKAINPSLTVTNEGLHIQWEAPTVGAEGGYINTEKLTYKVVRMPDNVTVYEGSATQFTDAFQATVLNKYWYDVTAISDGNVGETVSTNSIVLGESVEIPYYQDFTDFDAFDFFTVVDKNNDGITWMHEDDYAAYEYSETDAADDWLITPSLAISSAYVYELTASARALTVVLPERLEICFGYSTDALDEKLVKPMLVDWGEFKDITVQIRPKQDKAGRVGFHVMSDANQNELCINSIGIKKLASSMSPDSVTNLKAVAAEKGALQATVFFDLPTMALNGVNAADVKSVKVYRNNTLIATLTDNTDGDHCEVVDNAPIQGFNTYRVEATNDNEGCVSSSVRVYVGNDIPAVAQNIQLVDKGQGLMSLTWDAPTKGVNGGYINANSLTYDVNYCGSTERTVDSKANSYEEKIDYPADYQKLIWYSITSKSDAGEGAVAQSDTIFLGDSYKLPFAESFSRKSPDKRAWNSITDGVAEWKVENAISVDPQDGDGGCALFSPKLPGTTADFISPKIDMTSVENPVLTYWTWHHQQANNQISLYLRKSDGSEQLLESYNSNCVEPKELDYNWQKHTVYLKNNSVDDASQLVFRVVNKSFDITNVNYLAIDNITIRNVFDCDLRINEIYGDTEVKVGDRISFVLVVENYGALEVDDYNVELYRDNQLVHTVAGAPIAPEGKKTVQISDVPNADASQTSRYFAKIVCSEDQFLDNNTSETKVVTVKPGLPFVDNLTGEVVDGATVLSWDVPPTVSDSEGGESQDASTTDDFESYAAFTITNVGSWSLYDGDGATTGGILNNSGYFIQYDNVEKPMAYMVFNPSEAGLTATTWSAHSGNQVLASFLSSLRYNPDDDWLISPELDGSAQTITFWAKAPDRSYYQTWEDVEMLYSTTDSNPASFKSATSAIKVNSESWKQYSFSVPEGAKYFAIRKVSKDQYILYLDDITYRPATNKLKLLGYNVYRNDACITANPIASTTFRDLEAGVNSYTVTAVYDKGESIHSNVYSNESSGINSVATDKLAKVESGVGELRIYQPADHSMQIVTVDGRLLVTVTGSKVLNIPAGLYIVTTTGFTTKVLVK